MTAPKAGLRPLEAAARFWSRVDRSAGPEACWPWRGCVDHDGYGLASLDITRRAHRVAFVLCGGFIPEGQGVLHSCDNPPCCNPAHLRAGTEADNSADMVARGRSLAGDRNPNVVHVESRPRGSRNGWAKLTEAGVAVIKARLLAGESSQRVAADFGVTNGCIWFIQKGRNWIHVQPAGRAA